MVTNKTLLFLCATAISLFVCSCVDVDQTNYSTQDYRSLVRFVNAASDAQGTVSVLVDGATVGSLSFTQSTSYLDLQAGSRALSFAGASQNVTFITGRQATVFIHPLEGANRFIYMNEGDLIKNYSSNKPDTAEVKLLHVATGFAPDVSFRLDSAKGTRLGATVAYLADNWYIDLKAGDRNIYVVSNGGYMADLTGTAQPTPVTTKSVGSAAITLGVDAGLDYSVSVTSDNRVTLSDAFYTAAHFHVGAAGTNGPVVLPIGVTDQKITFPQTNLEGRQEVPSVKTTASGTGTFTLYSNSARTEFELDYSITVKADTSDPFVAAHFHRGAAGTSGPVIRPLAGGVFGDTTIEGEWKTSDSPPLTAARVESLLQGNMYVNFHTGAHPGGAIRAQLIPDSTSTNSYSGSWADMPDSLKDSLVSGKIYVNFHTAAHPTGQIRGQVLVDPTKGQYGVGSLSAADISFTAGKLYTLAAYAEGINLKVFKLTNRQAGTSKAELNSSDGMIHSKNR